MSELTEPVAAALAGEFGRLGLAIPPDPGDSRGAALSLARAALDAALAATDETIGVMGAAISEHGWVDADGFPNISPKAARGYAGAALQALRAHVLVVDQLAKLKSGRRVRPSARAARLPRRPASSPSPSL
jgi:hypothetical protein